MYILDSKYDPPIRPYSQKELKNIRRQNFKKLKLSSETVYHTKSGYFYHCKKFSKKDGEILKRKKEMGADNKGYNVDIGNCSVSWKLRNTPEEYCNTAYGIVEDYMRLFKDFSPKSNLTYYMVQLERIFHIWLYDREEREYVREYDGGNRNYEADREYEGEYERNYEVEMEK